MEKYNESNDLNVKIGGRLSRNFMSEEEIMFVNEKLNHLSKSQLVRKAIRVLYKHENGEIVDKEDFVDDISLIIDSIT